MIRFRTLLILVGLISIFAVVARSQSSSHDAEGTVRGVVVDWQNARVATTTIAIENKILRRRIVVNEIGEFEIRLPAGRYRITAEAPGFKTYRRNIVIRNGATESLNIKLNVIPQNFKCPRGSICL
jgi:hypothetical protein